MNLPTGTGKLFFVFLLAWGCFFSEGKTQHPLAAYVAVVFNANEPGAEDLARLYAKGRGIPEMNLIGIRCDRGETVSRDHFDFKIKWPIREELQKRKLYEFSLNAPEAPLPQEGIRYLVLIRGIPLKIANEKSNEPLPAFLLGPTKGGETPPPGLERNEAAVDSELCLLPFMKYPLSGPFPNFYFGAKSKFIGSNQIFLVTRLDGPSYSDVERMIINTLKAEKDGLKGRAFIDMRGIKEGPFLIGDQWLQTAESVLKAHRWPIVVDRQEALFGKDTDMRRAALYFGWYGGNVTGPFLNEKFEFVTGAIAYHIHSFSAATLRSPNANWCAPFISRGAVATMGAVYEPYLFFTPDVGIFLDRLFAGYNFAESAYAAQRMLSWQITMIGDPLYTPFPSGGGKKK